MILFYVLFEKLHRYVYTYCYNSTNTGWTINSQYKEANKYNKYAKYNDKIEKVYTFLFKYFWRFRYKLCLYFPKKYLRYSASNIRAIGKYEIGKYYNLIDKIVYNYRIKNKIY